MGNALPQANIMIQAGQGPHLRQYLCSIQQALDIKMLCHIIYNPQLLYDLVLEKQAVINHLPDSCLHTNALQTQLFINTLDTGSCCSLAPGSENILFNIIYLL